MTNTLITSKWMLDNFKRMLSNSRAFASRMTPVMRVRRHGFRRGIKRGDYEPFRDGTYCVVKRSRHSLWLEKVREAEMVGDTIRVRVPKRYEAAAQ